MTNQRTIRLAFVKKCLKSIKQQQKKTTLEKTLDDLFKELKFTSDTFPTKEYWKFHIRLHRIETPHTIWDTFQLVPKTEMGVLMLEELEQLEIQIELSEGI